MYNSVIWRHPQREEAPVVQNRQTSYTSLVNLGQWQDQKSNRFANEIHGRYFIFDMSSAEILQWHLNLISRARFISKEEKHINTGCPKKNVPMFERP